MDNEKVRWDHEDFLQFLKDNDLSNFNNAMILLQIALTIPVSSAHDERSFSCLMVDRTCMRSTMKETQLSNLATIAINCNVVQGLDLRELQKPFLAKKRFFSKARS